MKHILTAPFIGLVAIGDDLRQRLGPGDGADQRVYRRRARSRHGVNFM